MRGTIKGIVVLTGMMFLFGACATGSIQTKPLTPQKVEVVVTVKNAEGKAVKVSKVGDRTNKSMDIPNPRVSLSQMSMIAGKPGQEEIYTKIFSGLSVSDVTRLWNDIIYMSKETDIKIVNMFINSPGGDAFSGLALADQIERAKRLGITVKAYASGIIASAAVPVFAVCSERYAASGTIFMVHEAALWKWPGRETASDIRSQNELMDILRSRYLGYLVQYTKLDLKKWGKMERNTTWFDAEKALAIGLVDEIK